MAYKKFNALFLPNTLKTQLKRYLLLGLIFVFSNLLFNKSAFANQHCEINQISPQITSVNTLNKQTPLRLKIQSGRVQYSVNCQLQQAGVLSFNRSTLERFEWRQNDEIHNPIRYNKPAYFIDSGATTALLTLYSPVEFRPVFKWQPMPVFIQKSQQQNLILGLFYGLCITLILYVLIMGSRLNDDTFKLYSLYIFCIGGFILMQEGQLYLFLTSQHSSSLFNIYLLFIGLCVLSATWFICALLQIKTSWPKVDTALKCFAAVVMLFSVLQILFKTPQVWALLSKATGYVTLCIVGCFFVLSALQARKGIREATLVFIALSFVFVSMIFRILLIDESPFMRRYGLIIAFAVESFLLAVAVSRRISRMRIAKKRAETEADYDHLCGILNRRGWCKKSADLIEHHIKSDGVLCLIYIDLDDFKQINDTHGHAVGDQALCKVAHHLKAIVRSNDAIGRLGGDEFVVLAHFYTKAQVSPKVHFLKTELAKLFIDHNTEQLAIKASVGSAVFSDPPKNIDELLKAGDAAMYHEKLKRKATPLTLVDL